jgi:hypothetical protein
MKRHTVILPFLLPCLTDKAAMQLVALLHELIATTSTSKKSDNTRNHSPHDSPTPRSELQPPTARRQPSTCVKITTSNHLTTLNRSRRWSNAYSTY